MQKSKKKRINQILIVILLIFSFFGIPLRTESIDKSTSIKNESLGSSSSETNLEVEFASEIPGGTPTEIKGQDNYVYLAYKTGGIRAIDVTDNKNPTIVDIYNDGGDATDLVIDGEFAYIADGNNGIEVLNISNPANLQEIGSLYTGVCVGIALKDELLYTGNHYDGFKIVNVSDATSPFLIGTYSSIDAGDVCIYESYAYVADGSAGFKIINISNPTTPTEVGSFNDGGSIKKLTVQDDLLFVADGSGGLEIFNLSNPINPLKISSFKDGRIALSVVIQGSYAYLGNRMGINILDISNPYNPIEVARYHNSSKEVHGIYMRQDCVYLAIRTYGFQILWVEKPVTFDFQAIPDEDGFVIDQYSNNSYFLVNLEGGIEYAFVLLQNKSFSNETEIGELSLHLFNSDQIIDGSSDGVADITPNMELDLIEDFSTHEETFTQFVSVYIEENQTYAIYVHKYEDVPIKAYLFIQESPGCLLAEGEFPLDIPSVPSNMSYPIEEKSLIFHVPGYKFRLRSQRIYNPDDDFHPNKIKPHEFDRSTLTFFVSDGRIDGYLRVDLPWYVGFHNSMEYDTAIAMTWYHFNTTKIYLGREPDQKTVNFTVIYNVTGLGSAMKWNNTIRHTYLFNYIEPGHVKIKQNQIHTFDNFTIYDDNQGKYMNLFVVLFKFLPYYWKTVGAERIELSPTAEDYTGWYSLADFNFSSMVYSSDYELYLNNGTQSTEQCRTWVSFETGTAGDNWTWWYVRMPYIREFPNNHSAPWGNVSKIVYDPLVHYYFDLPPWMRPEVPDDQIPLIYGYNLYILINIICLISISYVMIQKRKKFK